MQFPAFLRFLCSQRVITAACFDLYMDAANDAKDAEISSILIDYQQNVLTGGKVDEARKKKEEKAEKDTRIVVDKALRRESQEGIAGLVFAVTGSLNTFPSRDEAKAFLESCGAKLASGVSANVDYLVTNDKKTGSAKNKKAKELGIKVIDEKEFNYITCRRFRDAEQILIPSWVKTIYGYAFENCRSLTSITIPDSVTAIRSCAFSGCTNLQSIIIPDSVTSIGSGAFEKCRSLTSITIPDSVTSLGSEVFSDCTSLTGVTIPEKLGYCDFPGCTGLTSVTIPNGLSKIPESAFTGCTGLTSVVIPSGVREIGRSAFAGCTSLTSVMIPDSVTTISVGAFENCPKLTNIVIPDSVTDIYEGAFTGCYGLADANGFVVIRGILFSCKKANGAVTIPDGVNTIAYKAFCGCKKLMSVTIPDSVTRIETSAFEACISLASVSIPESVTVIGRAAFKNCSVLTKITISRSVVNLGCYSETDMYYMDTSDGAFYNCKSLISVTIHDTVEIIPPVTFRSCDSLTEIHIIGDWPAALAECVKDRWRFYMTKPETAPEWVAGQIIKEE